MKLKLTSLIKGLVLVAICLLSVKTEAGLITTNLSTGTSVIWVGRAAAYEVTIASTTANLLNVYDTSSNALTYVVGSYTGSSNISGILFTNLQTNAIFRYSTTTQYLIQTNQTLSGAYRTNYTVPQTTNGVPPSVTLFVPAGQIVDLDALDLNFVNGITVTVTNSATLIIYTRN